VVVLENEVRPDTVGNIQPVEARYELLPRGQYAWHPNGTEPPVNTPKVSMKKYEELSQIYQAQNAIGAARAAGAAQYAPNTLAKAEQLLTTARQFEQNKTGDSSRVIQDAREAAQTAEDARAISERRKQEEKLAATASQVTAAQQAQAAAEAEAHRARSEAEAARAQADAERVARERAEAEAANARERAVQTQTAVPPPPPRRTPEPAQKPELRIRLLEQLNAPVATRDTPRGLVATLPDNGFSGTTLRAATADQIAQIAAIVAAHPGLRVEVEGHSDKADSQAMTAQRANAVRDVLIAHGLPPGAISARGLGNSRPLASNATEAGREENRRVEITISGEPIGNVPFWDKTYTLGSR
jgi:outer membrane protein OmpA-like peptidoglycan-associated protein